MTTTTPDVLVVDDEAAVRALATRWLAHAGHQVVEAATADEAVRLCSDHAPGVLVTDVQMPGHDGVWLVRHVRAQHPATAVIVISGDPAAARAVARARVGAFEYLTKPFTPEQLADAVDRGARWHEARAAERDAVEPANLRVCPPRPSAARSMRRPPAADWRPSPDALSRLMADVFCLR